MSWYFVEQMWLNFTYAWTKNEYHQNVSCLLDCTQVFGFLNEEASSMTLKVKEISWLGFDFDKTKNKKKENKGFLY